MRKRYSSLIVASALFAAAIALGQSADKNTAGPTANQLQLRLIEPVEGATITGSDVRISLNYNRTVFGQGQGTRFGDPDFPHPIFDIFLDNELKQTLKGGEANVATIENVPVGNHKIVVMAKNISGEVIDRKEVNVQTVAAAAGTSPAETSPAETTERTTATEPAPPPSERMEQEPATAPAAATTQERETTTQESESLPATGSNYPRIALLGLALVAMGLFLARKVR